MLLGPGGPSGEGYLRPEPVSLPGARPAQGHSIGNAERFLPYFVKFRMNFNLLRRTAGMRSAADTVWIEMKCWD